MKRAIEGSVARNEGSGARMSEDIPFSRRRWARRQREQI